MKKVLSIVLNEFKNDNRVLNEAVSLNQAGHEVTILGLRLANDIPLTENIGSIRVTRIDRFPGSGVIYRIPIVGKAYRIIKFNLNFFRFIWSSNCEIVHCNDLETLEYGYILKAFKKEPIKLVYDAHEYETQRNGLHGIPKLVAKIKERLLIRYCDKVLTVSNTIANEYVRLYGINKPTVVLNCPSYSAVAGVVKHNLFREKFGIPDTSKIFLYQGYLMPGRGIELILKAFGELKMQDAVLVFMGEGQLTSKINADLNFGKSVFLHPFVDGSILLQYTSSADCGISFIEDISLSDRYCLPNKLFEYIAAGLPVISSGLPELKEFMRRYQVGVASDTNNVEGFKAAFKELEKLDLDVLGKNITKARSMFNWGTQAKLLLEAYNEIDG